MSGEPTITRHEAEFHLPMSTAYDSSGINTLDDAYIYLIGQFAAGSGKKAGEFYTPQQEYAAG